MVNFSSTTYVDLNEFLERSFRRFPESLELLKIAFSYGGYVAGGFGRIAYNAFLDKTIGIGQTKLIDYIDRIEHNTRDPYPCITGDIDIFFPDQLTLDSFTQTVNERFSHLAAEPTATGSAVTYRCDSNHVDIQVITKFLAPIEDQLRGFDLYNAMVAFNNDRFIVADDWQVLEDKKLIHVNSWESPYTLKRIRKWMFKHNMIGLTPKSASEIGDYAVELLIKTNKDPNSTLWLNSHDITKTLKTFMSLLSVEQLLLLAPAYTKTDYGGAFQELFRRVSSEKQSLRNSIEF